MGKNTTLNKERLLYFINHFLDHYPPFFSLIRSQEAYFFSKHTKLKKPSLDFGCGDGHFAKTCFEGSTIDVGLDVIQSRINESKKENIYRETIIYDGNIIPFPSSYFSTVVSNCVLEHIAHIDKTLAEISRVTKKNGLFYTTVMAARWDKATLGNKIFGRSYQTFMRKQQVHINLLTPKQWRKAFENVGFEVVDEVGYLSDTNSLWLDIMHYFSIPSLIEYKFFGRWTLMSSLLRATRFDRFVKSKISIPIKASRSAAIWYILKKKHSA